MMRFGRMLIVGGMCLALGLAGREARASFLVEVSASLNAPTTDSGSITVGQSTVSVAALSGLPADLGLAATAPVHEIYGATQVSSGNTTGVDAFNIPYSWTLTFSHDVGGQVQGPSATLIVSGDLAGDLSVNGSTLGNTFTAGPVLAATSLSVDGQTIFVKLDPWTPPGTPFSEVLDFGLAISTGPDGSFHTAPEPATMALMGVGGLILLVAPRLRRRPAAKGA